MITKFNIFEARVSDMMTTKSDALKSYANQKFEIEREFKKYFTINKKMRFHILWNQTEQHDIYFRIKQRHIDVKSISELNDKIKAVLEEIPYLIENNEIYATGKYGIVLTESNFSIIFRIDLQKYMNQEYEIQIKTIMSMTALNDVIRVINLHI